MLSFKEFLKENRQDSDEVLDEAKMTPTQRLKRDIYLKTRLAPKLQKYISLFGKAKARTKMIQDANKYALKPLGEHFYEEDFEEMSDEDFEMVIESYEVLSELSKKTLVSYVGKAEKSIEDMKMRRQAANRASASDSITAKDRHILGKYSEHVKNQEKKRDGNVGKALNKIYSKTRQERLTKEDIDNNLDQLDELSQSTLKSYYRKASDSAVKLRNQSGDDHRNSQAHFKTGLKANKVGDRENTSHHMEISNKYMDDSKKKFAKSMQRVKGLGKAAARLKEDIDSTELAKEISAYILETIITNKKLTKEEFDLLIDDLSSIMIEGE